MIGDSDGLQDVCKVVASRVTEALVPKVGDRACEEAGGGGGWCYRVEVAVGITSEEHLEGTPILNRKISVIKFNVNMISVSKSTDRKKVFD